jgi:predicted DsbA family dithiol-disulfide isomerase
MVFPNRIPNTRLAHESTEYARQHGKALEFHKVIFDKFYGKGEDIGNWEFLRKAAIQVGLNADELQYEVESGKFTSIVQEQVNEAYQIGVDGVPTYVLNDQYKIVGAQPYEVFQRALQQIEMEEKS